MVKYSCHRKKQQKKGGYFTMEYSTKILIADENAAARANMKEGLLRAGYHNVEEATNGEETLNLIRQFAYTYRVSNNQQAYSLN